jgi:hypothetical protein
MAFEFEPRGTLDDGHHLIDGALQFCLSLHRPCSLAARQRADRGQRRG